MSGCGLRLVSWQEHAIVAMCRVDQVGPDVLVTLPQFGGRRS